jgi:2-polyprenyl-3-methyl-5-hydroxy-6-metoxy-1,4-benzoquinol methylase
MEVRIASTARHGPIVAAKTQALERGVWTLSEVAQVHVEIDYTRHYRRWHDDSDDHFASMASGFARKLEPLLPAQRSARILEIGCGMGFALGGLQQLGYDDIHGIDSDRGQVAMATRRGLPVSHVPLAASNGFFAENMDGFDVVMCIDVLEHVPVDDQLAFLRQLHGTLKAGGRLICQVPNANSGIASRYRYIDWTHHCSFSEASLDFVLHNAGFVDIRIMESNPIVRPRLPFILRRSVANWLLRQAFHTLRRLEYAAEVGWPEARSLPLTPNIMATAAASRPK